MEVPFITITMPVRNEEQYIEDTLHEVLGQNYPPDRFEIIVADGGSSDSTRDIVADISSDNGRVILKENPGMFPSSGRNVGFKNGRGDIFLVIDGHCQIKNRQLLLNVAELFEQSGADCLGRPQPFIIPEEPNVEKAIAVARRSRLGHSCGSFIHSDTEGFVSPVSVGCAYRREVFEKIGFVDESFDACEDVEFNYRVEKAGLKTFLSPKIKIWYFPRKTLRKLALQLIRYGEGRARFMFKHPETIRLGNILPLIFCWFLLAWPVAVVLGKEFSLIYLAILGLYFSIVLLEAVRLGLRSGGLFVFYVGMAFFTIHFSLGIGLTKGLYKLVGKWIGGQLEKARY